jgi:serine/threonine protein kinase
VNIVLEYCDWGCLRDALDAGAFYSGGSLNYAAILDTAADVAKAMLHLHCNQVRGFDAGANLRLFYVYGWIQMVLW